MDVPSPAYEIVLLLLGATIHHTIGDIYPRVRDGLLHTVSRLYEYNPLRIIERRREQDEMEELEQQAEELFGTDDE